MLKSCHLLHKIALVQYQRNSTVASFMHMFFFCPGGTHLFHVHSQAHRVTSKGKGQNGAQQGATACDGAWRSTMGCNGAKRGTAWLDEALISSMNFRDSQFIIVQIQTFRGKCNALKIPILLNATRYTTIEQSSHENHLFSINKNNKNNIVRFALLYKYNYVLNALEPFNIFRNWNNKYSGLQKNSPFY